MVINRLLALSALILSIGAQAHGNQPHNVQASIGLDLAPAKVVAAFRQALQQGNQQQARAQLADDVLIYEGGGIERSAQEYAEHHMLADMKYLAGMQSKTIEQQVKLVGTMAISTTKSQVTGSYNGQAKDYQSLETMVLQQQQGSWKIIHIHWSN